MAKRERDGLFQRKGSRYWWVRTDPITGKAESTGCLDREAARLWRANRERLHANPAYAAATQARLDDWMTNYIETNTPTWSEATLAIAKEKLGHFVRLWGYEVDGEWRTDVMLADIGPGSFDEFVKARREEGVSDHTVSKEVAMLTRVLKLAKRAGCYAVDIDTLRPPSLSTSYEPRERALTREEFEALCAELPPDRLAFVAICVALGVRRSEAFRVRPENVDLEAGRVLIHSAKVRKGSKKKTRVLPILSLGRGLVEAALPYLPFQGEPVAVNTAIRRACERAKIAHCSPNDLRRTNATMLAEAGIDADITRRLLGQKTRRLVDQIYGRPRVEALAELAEERLARVVPLLAPIRDSQSAVLTESGRPQRESNPRYRRERLIQCSTFSPTCNDSAALERTRRPEPTRKRSWLRSDLEQSREGIWLGRRGRAVA